MSLFIWNDRDWKLVDVRTKFDKDVYVVVRKLFVQWVKEVSLCRIEKKKQIKF